MKWKHCLTTDLVSTIKLSVHKKYSSFMRDAYCGMTAHVDASAENN